MCIRVNGERVWPRSEISMYQCSEQKVVNFNLDEYEWFAHNELVNIYFVIAVSKRDQKHGAETCNFVGI